MDAVMDSVTVTERAARRIRKVLGKEPDGTMLRISVNGGGCSGFQYAFDITRERDDDDIVIERDGAGVLVDPTSMEFMHGSVIDFVDDLMGQSFQIQNPNVSSSCGCGVSFAL